MSFLRDLVKSELARDYQRRQARYAARGEGGRSLRERVQDTADVLDMLADAGDYAGTVATGAGFRLGRLAMPTTGRAEDRALIDAAIANAGGNPIGALRDVNQRVAAEHPIATGFANAALDPTNLIGGPLGRVGGALADVPKLGKLGAALKVADEAATLAGDLPFRALLAGRAKRALASAAGEALRRDLDAPPVLPLAQAQPPMRDLGLPLGPPPLAAAGPGPKATKAARQPEETLLRQLKRDATRRGAQRANQRGTAIYGDLAALPIPRSLAQGARLDALGDWSAPAALDRLPTINESVAAIPARRTPEAPLDVTQAPADRLLPEPDAGDLPDVDAAVKRAQELQSLVNPRALTEALGFAYNGDPTHALRNVTGGVSPQRMTAPQRFAVADWVLAKVNGEPEEVAKQNAVRALFRRPEKGAGRATRGRPALQSAQEVADGADEAPLSLAVPPARGIRPLPPDVSLAGDAAQRPAAVLPSAPAPADLAVPGGLTGDDAYARAVDLVRTRDEGRDLQYLPLNPDWYAKRGIDPAEAPGLIRRLVDEGLVGGADEQYALLPEAGAAAGRPRIVATDAAGNVSSEVPLDAPLRLDDAFRTAVEPLPPLVTTERPAPRERPSPIAVDAGPPAPPSSGLAYARALIQAAEDAGLSRQPLVEAVRGRGFLEGVGQGAEVLARLDEAARAAGLPEAKIAVIRRQATPAPTFPGADADWTTPEGRAAYVAGQRQHELATTGASRIPEGAPQPVDTRAEFARLKAEQGAAQAPTKPTGGDLAAGGGMGLTPFPTGLTRQQAVARVGQAFGLDPTEFVNAVDASVAALGRDFDPSVKRINPVTSPFKWVGAGFRQWRASVVATIRNVGQGKLFSRYMAAEYGTPQAYINTIKREQDAARLAAPDDEYAQLGATLQQSIAGWTGQQLKPDVGSGFLGEEVKRHDSELGPFSRAAVGALLGISNPSGLINPLAGAVSGAVRGYLQPATSAFARELEQSTNLAARKATFGTVLESGLQAAAADFLARGGAAVADLKGRRFTPQEVETRLGRDAARAWRTLLAGVWTEAETYTKFVYGDYSDAAMKGWKAAANKVFPFTSFVLNTWQPAARIAAKRPGVTANIIEARQEDRERAEREGRPEYLVGTLPLPGTDRRVDPLQLASPLPFDLIGGMVEQANPTALQRALGPLNAAGFQLDPRLQAAAYVAGQDWRRPGPLSRFHALEQAAPGPLVASPAQGALDTARNVVSTATGGLVPKASDSADAVERRMAELVLAQTGKPLGDPANGDLLRQSFDRDSPLYREAEADVKRTGAQGGAASALLPVSTPRDNPAANANRRAKASKYSYAEIKAAKDAGDTRRAAFMQAVNDRRDELDPAGATYDTASASSRQYALVEQFEREQAAIKRRYPKTYAARKARFIREMREQGVPLPAWFTDPRGGR